MPGRKQGAKNKKTLQKEAQEKAFREFQAKQALNKKAAVPALVPTGATVPQGGVLEAVAEVPPPPPANTQAADTGEPTKISAVLPPTSQEVEAKSKQLMLVTGTLMNGVLNKQGKEYVTAEELEQFEVNAQRPLVEKYYHYLKWSAEIGFVMSFVSLLSHKPLKAKPPESEVHA